MKTYSSHVLRNHKSLYTHTHILAHTLTICKGFVTSSPANSVMVSTPMNYCRENGERPGQEGGRSNAANAPLTSQ